MAERELHAEPVVDAVALSEVVRIELHLSRELFAALTSPDGLTVEHVLAVGLAPARYPSAGTYRLWTQR